MALADTTTDLHRLRAIAETLAPRLIEIRRHFHANPELSGQEHKTSAYVAGVLSSCGLHVREGVAQTGAIGELTGNGSDDRYLAIRTDMDALPIREDLSIGFASKIPGVMHACGHDVHATVGLGTAMVLAQIAGELPGNVRFLFQPAEETAQGAKAMVADGAMDGIDAVFGLHVFPSILAKVVGIRYGALTAAADDLEIKIFGESGHGARPHQATDAIWIASQVVVGLQQAIGRMHNPLRPVVLSIGTIQGGRAPNVIADAVTLRGTVRSLHPDTHAELPGWIESIVAGICNTYGGRYEMNYSTLAPSVQNDRHLTDIVESAVRDIWGDRAIELLPEPSLGAEDFAVYLDRAPGMMFRLGVGHRDKPNYPLHHPRFEVDEAAIVTGVTTMAAAAWRYFRCRR
ncbi:MAG: M20 family metallopeptidase [Geitlerinemataceae cyanobacterium]